MIKTNHTKKTIAAALPLALLLVPAASLAQSCSSTGADGAYSPTTSGFFDPVALKLNAAGDNVFNFTSITIPANVTITMQAHLMKSQRPVVFLVSGAVNIQGELNLSGATGNAGATQFEFRTPSEPGPGGYPGGAGAMPNSSIVGRGAGPGSVAVPATTTNGCSASYTYPVTGGTGCTAGAIYGIPQILPLVGGSGGSGGGSTSATATGGSGGAGGGAIRICSDTSITANQIYANGGSGGAGTTGTYEGGAGSGGAIYLQSPSVSLTYYGGTYIQAAGGSEPYVTNASVGRIRIDTDNLTGGGSTNPPAYFGSHFAVAPGLYGGVPLPTPPTLTIASINGNPVPVQPVNNYSPPDVTLNSTSPVPIVVNTKGIPDNTTATFYITTDSSATTPVPDIVTTATVKSNTATLNVTLPNGVNRLFVRAVF